VAGDARAAAGRRGARPPVPRMGEHRGHAGAPALRARPPSESPPGGVGRRRHAGRSGAPAERTLRPGGDQGLRLRRA
jgi:hypothetical protein